MISTSRHRKVWGTLNALYYKLLKFPGTLRQSLSNLRFHNLSSLRPYEVTDFGETTIHGDDQAKNEVCYTSGMYLILHGKIVVWRQDMMEEGVNMIKELIKIKENNNIVSIFCDEDDTSMFLEGYIYAIGRQDFLIKHITPHGLADGYILKKIDSVMHLEISGQYEKK